MKSSTPTLLLGCSLFLAGLQGSFGAFGFVPGNYYSADSSSLAITEYTSSGTVVGSFNVPANLGSSLRGIAFGPDGLLYATAVQGSGFGVLAFDSSGALRQDYQMSSVYLAGSAAAGNLAVDTQHIYVAGADQVTRFNLGDPSSGTSIYQNNQLYDVNLLPNGDLFAASAYYIDEITSSGAFVRNVPGNFTDIRGIQYNPANNTLFVTELGTSAGSFQLLRLDATSGAVQASTSFWYGNDMFLTDTGSLLVGSWTLAPGIFNQNLVQTGSLGSNPQMYVTEFVPEPSSLALLVSSVLTLFAVRKTRNG